MLQPSYVIRIASVIYVHEVYMTSGNKSQINDKMKTLTTLPDRNNYVYDTSIPRVNMLHTLTTFKLIILKFYRCEKNWI